MKLNPEIHLFFFADLIGSTEAASEMRPASYASNYLASLHWACNCAWYWVCKGYQGVAEASTFMNTPKVLGDEVSSFTCLAEYSDNEREDIIATAVSFSYVLKLFWLASPYNTQRIADHLFPRDIAVGLHIGPAVGLPTHYPYIEYKADTIRDDEIGGFHINVAKRIETEAHSGNTSRIFASTDVQYWYKKWRKRIRMDAESSSRTKEVPPISFFTFQRAVDANVKGISEKFSLFELGLDIEKEADRAKFEIFLRNISNEGDHHGLLVKTMSEAILLPGKRPFYGSDNEPFVNHSMGNSVREYIIAFAESLTFRQQVFGSDTWKIYYYYLVSSMLFLHGDYNALHSGKHEIPLNNYYELQKTVIEQMREYAKRSIGSQQ